MAYRSEIEKRYTTAITMLPSYCAKFKNICLTALYGLTIGLVLVFLVFLTDELILKVNYSDFLQGISVSASKLFDFMPESVDELNVETGIPAEVLRIVGFALVCIYSGVLVAKFLAPRQIVQFAPFAVIDTKSQLLRIRYRIGLPLHNYLNNVSLYCCISDADQRNSGLTQRERYYQYYLPRPTQNGNRNAFTAMRGVWYIEVPLDQIDDGGMGLTLEECFNTLSIQDVKNRNKMGLEIEAWVSGSTSNGEQVFARREYSFDAVMLGYNFVSIWRYEVEDVPKQELDLKNDPRQFFPEHFSMISRTDPSCHCNQKSKTGLQILFGTNKPNDIYCLEEKKCIERWWGIKRLFKPGFIRSFFGRK